MDGAPVHYQHRQVGWTILATATAALALTDAALLGSGARAGALAATLVTATLLLLFSSLTVRVDARKIEARFGIGVIRKRVEIGAIRSTRAVHNSWLLGWGIRLFPGGVLYNVSGLEAVELVLADGRRVRIGTDEPTALLDAIAQVAGASQLPPSLEQPGTARAGPGAKLVVAVLLLVPAVLAVLFALELREPTARVDRHGLSVASTLYSDSVPSSDITAVTLLTAPPPGGVRTNGFAVGATLRGHFRLPGYGDGMVFANRDVPPYVLVRTRRSFLIVGFADPARTRALFEQIQKERSQ